jgi:hypothetical protein
MDFFESLPFAATTLIVAAISVLAVALLTRITAGWVPWVAAVTVPLAIAYVIYWAPFWINHRTNIADYSAWEPLAVGCWGLAGVAGSLVLVYLLRRRTALKNEAT